MIYLIPSQLMRLISKYSVKLIISSFTLILLRRLLLLIEFLKKEILYLRLKLHILHYPNMIFYLNLWKLFLMVKELLHFVTIQCLLGNTRGAHIWFTAIYIIIPMRIFFLCLHQERMFLMLELILIILNQQLLMSY